MKVVLAGPSGSGKTTLAKALAAHFEWGFIENSAGLIMLPEDKKNLKDWYGYAGNWGQRKVINESHIKPEFGRNFQWAIINARKHIINTPDNHIFDRSALDPIVFYLNQVVHNDEQEISEHFIHSCIAGLKEVDLILRIPLQNPNKVIENNGSRVNNWYFQRKIDALYDEALRLVQIENQISPYILDGKVLRVEKCPCWEWTKRFQWATNAISHLVYGY